MRLRLPPSLFLAFRYLRFGRGDSFISVVAGFSFIGLTLGVATLIVVMSVMNGFRAQLMGRILGINGHVSVYQRSDTPQKTAWVRQQLYDKLTAIEGVKAVYPVLEKQLVIFAGGAARGALVRGMDQEVLRKRPFLKESLPQGGLQKFQGAVIFVGRKLADALGVYTGAEVTLVRPTPEQTAFGSLPVFKRVRIAGLCDFQMNEYDKTLVLMPVEEAQRFFGWKEATQGLEVFLQDAEGVESVLPHLEKEAAVYGASVISWQQANQTFFSVIQVERNVMFLILTLIILVAAFNIVACLVMLVKDKRRDIGILRAMGSSKGLVSRVFIWVSFLLGIAGAALGCCLGVLVALNMETIRQFFESLTGATLFPAEFYFLSKLPAQLAWSDVLGVSVMTVSIALLSGLYPALRALSIEPHQALRFE